MKTTTSQSVEAAGAEATTPTVETAPSAKATTSAVETASAAKATASTEPRESWCCSEEQDQQHRAELTCSLHDAPLNRAPAPLAIVLGRLPFPDHVP
jgi:hypothetical protein